MNVALNIRVTLTVELVLSPQDPVFKYSLQYSLLGNSLYVMLVCDGEYVSISVKDLIEMFVMSKCLSIREIQHTVIITF